MPTCATENGGTRMLKRLLPTEDLIRTDATRVASGGGACAPGLRADRRCGARPTIGSTSVISGRAPLARANRPATASTTQFCRSGLPFASLLLLAAFLLRAFGMTVYAAATLAVSQTSESSDSGYFTLWNTSRRRRSEPWQSKSEWLDLSASLAGGHDWCRQPLSRRLLRPSRDNTCPCDC